MLNFVAKFCRISPRFGKNENRASKIIKRELILIGAAFKEQPFKSAVPRYLKAELRADGILIPCLGSGLVSGKIPNAKYLISAVGLGGRKYPYNINYNQFSDEICVVDFHWAPSVAVSRAWANKLATAEKVAGRLAVKKEYFKSENILAGNTKNPQNIIFGHYDSIIGDGALDNAGAIAVMIDAISLRPKLLKNNLFVFAGNEEISYDNYKYRSGFGFRVFESKYGVLLAKCKRIIVVDGVGIGKPLYTQKGLKMVFQVKMLERIKHKVFWLQNDQSRVLRVFHTKDDKIKNLKESYLRAAAMALMEKLRL